MIFGFALAATVSNVSQFMALSYSSESLQQLEADLDFSAITNYKSLNFIGTLDGQGHIIKNLIIKEQDIQCSTGVQQLCEVNVGLFGKSDYLQIQNVYFQNVSVQLKSSSATVDQISIGVLLGQGNIRVVNTSMLSCLIKVQNEADAKKVFVGGVVGYTYNVLDFSDTILDITFEISGTTQTNFVRSGGVAGYAFGATHLMSLFRNNITINVSSNTKVMFGGVSSFVSGGSVEQTIISLNATLTASGNIVGGFFANQPESIRVTNCRNILGGEGSTELSFGGVFAGIPDNTTEAKWNITNLVSQFALIVAPITINVVNGTKIIPCKNCYGSPLHKTPILYTYTYCNKTETDSFVLDFDVWYINKTNQLPYLKRTAAGPYKQVPAPTFGFWSFAGVALAGIIVGAVVVAIVFYVKRKGVQGKHIAMHGQSIV